MNKAFSLLDADIVAAHAPDRGKRANNRLARVASRAARGVDKGALRLMERLFLSGEVPIGRDLRADLDRFRAVYAVDISNLAEVAKVLAPGSLVEDVEVTERKALRGGSRMRMRYLSQFRTMDPAIQDWYSSYDNNEMCDVLVYRHDDASRPTVICLHAWCMGTQWLDDRMFAAQTLYDRGFHVVLPTLPFHGTRTPSRAKFGGQLFPSPRLDRTNEAARQAIGEVRDLRAYLEGEGHEGPFGLMGISLGGYLSATLASVWDDWAFVVPIIAPVSFADVIWRHGESRSARADAEQAGVSLGALREIWRVHTPLSYQLALDRSDVLLVAATGDEIVRSVHGRTLHSHWNEPELRWVLGGHIAQLRWVTGKHVTRRGHVDFMAEVLPFLDRYR